VGAIVRATHEKKNLDTVSYNNTLSGTAYTAFLLNSINQGTGANNRTGREVLLDSLRLSMLLYNASTQTGDLARVVVVQDKECRGSAAGTADVLQASTFGTAQLLSSHNFDNVPTRFKVLFDKTYRLVPTVSTSATNAAWNEPFIHDVCHIPLRGKTHFYNTSGNGIGDIDSGSIYLFVFGYASAAESVFSLDSRLIYRDI
jgi:hypothetical protein